MKEIYSNITVIKKSGFIIIFVLFIGVILIYFLCFIIFVFLFYTLFTITSKAIILS